MELSVYGDSISLYYEPYLYELVSEEGVSYKRIGGGNLTGLANGHNNGESTKELIEWIFLHGASVSNQTILLNCGLHDVKRNRKTREINVDKLSYAKKLAYAIELFEKNENSVIWVSTTPVNDEIHNTRLKEFFRFNEDVIIYNKVAKEIMENKGIKIIDLYEYIYPSLEEDIFRDHVHFKTEVCKRQAEFIWQNIKELNFN